MSPLGQVVENVWFRRADLDEKGGIVAWTRSALYPAGSLDQADITRETIWGWALGSADEAQELLIEATRALARLTTSLGVIAELQPVYRWPDGKVQLERPKSGWLEGGITQE